MKCVLSILVLLVCLANAAIAADEPYTFIQLADTQLGFTTGNKDLSPDIANFRKAVEYINRTKPAFVVISGDMVNRPRDPKQIRAFWQVAREIRPDVKLYLVPGNHDIAKLTQAGINSYTRLFGPDHYSFSCNGSRFIVLNSCLIKQPDADPNLRSEQLKWFESELASAQADGSKHIFVLVHQPWFLEKPDEADQYFNIPKSERQVYLDLMRKYGVEFTIAGHYHREAIAKDGSLTMITTSAVSKPLGKEPVGFRIFKVGPGLVEHKYQPLYEEEKPKVETKEQRDKRMAWWREARFGMFIHWGLYAVPAGEWNGEKIGGIGEWIMHHAKIPVKDYEALAAKFNPVKYNAEEWVKLAKEAGMKYIVITSKHHDGFAMFHSKTSSYNIYDATPFKRDPLKELAEACRKHGIRLGFYYSQAQDWHHPGGAAAGGRWDPAQDGSMDDYIRNIAVPQVRELLSNYGHVSILWWDTPVDMTKERADMLLPLLDLQPGIIWNNRLGYYEGDLSTPEQFIPATGTGKDWETCMTMNDTWGFKSYDNNWKSTTTLVRNLIDIASKGGNYLLNVGPTAEGEIPAASVERLKEIGKWMKVNGEAIYATGPSPFKRLSFDGRCTTKGSRLYLHVFNWPAEGIRLEGLKNRIKSARFLDGGAEAEIQKTGDSFVIAPPSKSDPIAAVVVLELDGNPIVENPPIRQQEDGSFVLHAFDADVHGNNARYESGHGKDNIGFWTNVNDYVSWDIECKREGDYKIKVTYACPDENAGSEYTVGTETSSVKGKVLPTGNWTEFKTESLGTIHLKTGRQTIIVKPLSMPKGAVMNLKAVELWNE